MAPGGPGGGQRPVRLQRAEATRTADRAGLRRHRCERAVADMSSDGRSLRCRDRGDDEGVGRRRAAPRRGPSRPHRSTDRVPDQAQTADPPSVHGPGPRQVSRGARLGVLPMPIDTPAWVRDAVFYQIFPDRFARERPGPEARAAGAVGRAADHPRVQGRRSAGIVEHLDYLERPGDQRAVPDAGLPVGLESSLPHVRLLRRSIPCSAATRPCGSCSTRPTPRDAGRARWRVQPHRSRLLAVPPRAGDRRRLALPRLVPPRPTRRARRRPTRSLRRTRRAGTTPARVRLRGVVGLAGAAEAEHRRSRRSASTCSGVAEHWLRFGIDGWRLDVPRRSTTRRSGRSSGDAAGRSTRRRTWSARSGGWRPTGCAATGSTR